MFRRGARVRPVRTAGVSAALTLALSDPLRNTLAGARLREVGHAGNAAQEFLLAGDEHRPEGLLWNGVNVSPLSATAQALDDFGRYLAPRTRRASSVVGDRGAVEALWQHLAMRWAPRSASTAGASPCCWRTGPAPPCPRRACERHAPARRTRSSPLRWRCSGRRWGWTPWPGTRAVPTAGASPS